jgi:terminase small subunit / prophage DNA-packing protein
VDLDQPCLQADFAALVGISQPAVSELLTRGILKPRQAGRVWLLAYTQQLREQAAGRGADGELAINRAAESATRNELLQIKLKKARGDFTDVALIEQVLAHVGTQIASKLEPLPARIKMLCPQLTSEDLKGIEASITDARNLAAKAGLALLADVDVDEEDAETDELDDAP